MQALCSITPPDAGPLFEVDGGPPAHLSADGLAELRRLRPYLFHTEPRRLTPFMGAHVWTIDPVLAAIERALKALGNTSGQVASRLTAMSCAGERHNPCFCPVINYLKRQRVGAFSLALYTGGYLEVIGRDGWEDTLRVPVAVEIFHNRFDRGEFPDLAVDGSSPGSRVDLGLPVTVDFDEGD